MLHVVTKDRKGIRQMKLFNTIITFAQNKVVAPVKHYSPEIALVGGIGLTIAGTILACRATLKSKDVIDETNDKLDKLESELDSNEKYEDDSDLEKVECHVEQEITRVKIDMLGKLAKEYILPAAVYSAGIGLTLLSHKLQSDRIAALCAAYGTLNSAFIAYKERVEDVLGKEKAEVIEEGVSESAIEKGINEKDLKKVDGFDPRKISPYARFFDESCKQWSPDLSKGGNNFDFVREIQDYMNLKLESRGYIFLNEVYESLDIPPTEAGQVVGWMSKENGGVDGYIDLGLYSPYNTAVRQFVNGNEPSILLDFNVDGVIIDKVGGLFPYKRHCTVA